MKSRFLATTLGMCLLALTAGAQTQPPVTPTASSPPAPARKVTVGLHSLYINCLGEGRPTVIMEAGYGDPSDVWAAVQTQVAAFTRVCVYDRAGLGKSGPAPERTVQAVVDDLAALLPSVPVDGPVVVVGHSVGGLIANMLAHQHPERVAGLVLVDSSHPDQLPRLRRGLPPEWLGAVDTFFADAPAFETWSSDHATAQGETVYAQAGSLADTPLVVLTRDVELISSEGVAWIQENIWPGYSAAVDRVYGQAWLELQGEVAALSSRSSHIVVEGSTHYIHKDKPEVVVGAVRTVVEAVWAGDRGTLAKR